MTPRAFTDEERERVRETLLEVATAHFARFGYRRANVAQIAAETGIGKGSLYLFFASKIELFLGVVLRMEEAHRRWLADEMRGEFVSARARLKHFLRFAAESLQQSPLLAVMTDPQEAAALRRDLPPAAAAELHDSDDVFFRELALGWQRDGTLRDIDPAVVAALPRAIFALILQREIIGREVFPAVLELVIDSLSRALEPA